MIHILFFGRLRELLQCNQLEFSIQSSTLTISQLRSQLRQKGGNWDEFLNTTHALVAVNQAIADENVLVKSGDEVAFFPPVTGG